MNQSAQSAPSQPPGHHAAPEDLAFAPSLLDVVETAFWIYGFESGRIVWANRAALTLWDADSREALSARELAHEMSPSVRLRLDQHREDFALDSSREIHEFWTLYPQGKPFRVRATLRAFTMEDGHDGMLVEAQKEAEQAPTTIRSADALLHTKVITALFNGEGAELYANPAFRKAFGPGKHHFGSDFAHASDAAHIRDGLKKDGSHRATVEVRTIEGLRWHDIHAARCRDAVTGDGAFLISAFDVTEAREQQHQLAEALDASREADLAKSQFLATMSHEMRTPLNGVLGMAGILSGSGLNDPQRRAVDVIAASGGSMLEMVEDMLDIVSLERGTVDLSPAPYDPALLLRAASETLRETAGRKGITLEIDTRHLRPGVYINDASRLRQVLRHMLGNAVKFTDSGGVVARAISVIGTDGFSRLRFEIADTGPGVPEAQRHRVFERFHQIDQSATRRHGGTGLGLSICQEFVALWGGQIGLSCGEKGGSTFWFDTPAVVASSSAQRSVG